MSRCRRPRTVNDPSAAQLASPDPTPDRPVRLRLGGYEETSAAQRQAWRWLWQRLLRPLETKAAPPPPDAATAARPRPG